MKKITVLIFICIVFYSVFAYAAIDDNSPIFRDNNQLLADFSSEGPRPDEVSIYSIAFKTLGILAIIIGLIFLFFKYILKKAKFAGLSNNLIKIVTTLPLAQNKMLSIVEVEGNYILIGVTENSINKLMDIDPKDITDKIDDAVKKPQKFSDALNSEINLNKAKDKLKSLKGLI